MSTKPAPVYSDARINASVGGMWKEEWRAHAGPVARYLDTARQAVREVARAAAAVRAAPGPNATVGGRTLADFARDRLKTINSGASAAELGEWYQAARSQARGPLEALQSQQPASAPEIRRHVATLPDSERLAFLARHAADPLTAAAVLSGPAYLSGLSDEKRATFEALVVEAQFPAVRRQLEAIEGAHAEAMRSATVATEMIAEAAKLRLSADRQRWLAPHEADDTQLTPTG